MVPDARTGSGFGQAHGRTLRLFNLHVEPSQRGSNGCQQRRGEAREQHRRPGELVREHRVPEGEERDPVNVGAVLRGMGLRTEPPKELAGRHVRSRESSTGYAWRGIRMVPGDQD